MNIFVMYDFVEWKFWSPLLNFCSFIYFLYRTAEFLTWILNIKLYVQMLYNTYIAIVHRYVCQKSWCVYIPSHHTKHIWALSIFSLESTYCYESWLLMFSTMNNNIYKQNLASLSADTLNDISLVFGVKKITKIWFVWFKNI